MNLKIAFLSVFIALAPASYASSEPANKVENHAALKQKRIKLAKGYAAYAYGALCGFGSLVTLSDSFWSLFDTNSRTVYNPATNENEYGPRSWGNSLGNFMGRSVTGIIGSVGLLHCAIKILKYAEKKLQEANNVE